MLSPDVFRGLSFDDILGVKTAEIPTNEIKPSLRIALVDDDSSFNQAVEMMSEVLPDGKRPDSLKCYTDPQDASREIIEKSRNGEVTVAIIDRNLPGIKGEELAASLRRAGVEIPIILQSSQNRQDSTLPGNDGLSASGIDAFMEKSAMIEDLDRLEKTMDLGRRLIAAKQIKPRNGPPKAA
ncbi:MAG: hypothetical protein A2857_03145 [Candidatus Levybacteria bacterium RIFCSPHIGHO2_01_FULL_36_15]|nr:MAG: hypothetical protein A2857_03145 [Candidatus Levybacteria bacterium RIFCSPHIGHO2_01_FULL_36_15]OGH38245.1 MAG: hypothetical protein A2905_03375 [Candidatus Levybacteria bacterium RIFCSPLOWO2_01_FULL_36_10]